MLEKLYISAVSALIIIFVVIPVGTDIMNTATHKLTHHISNIKL